MLILPVPTTTSSLKVRMISASMSTPVAPSDGEEEDKVGFVSPPVAAAVKVTDVALIA